MKCIRAMFLLLPLVWSQQAYSQTEIHYKVQTLETLNIQDFNNKKDLLISLPFETHQALLNPGSKGRKHPIPIDCPGSPDGTVARRVTEKQVVAGRCTAESGDAAVGFIRHRSGQYDFISVPGANITEVFGVNDKGHVVGQYYTLTIPPDQSGFERIHGFMYDGTNYHTIDFPGEFAVTALLGINNNGRIVGAFFEYDPITNGAGEWTSFIYENGNFTPLVYPVGSWTYVLDINNNDQVIGMFDDLPGGFQGGPSEPFSNGYFFHDDGIFFKVALPTSNDFSKGFPITWDVNGMNDKGELTGTYRWTEECTLPPGADRPICVGGVKGFIATPIRRQQLKKVSNLGLIN